MDDDNYGNQASFRPTRDIMLEHLTAVALKTGVPTSVIGVARRDAFPKLIPVFDSWTAGTPPADIHYLAKDRHGLSFPFFMAKSAISRSRTVWCGTSVDALDATETADWSDFDYICISVLPGTDGTACKALVNRLQGACMKGSILVTAALTPFAETFIGKLGNGLIVPQEV